jgi:alpha-L-glutamate ligase-like protein
VNGWITPKKLSHLGILGMNRRNVAYIGRYNARHRFPMVDDKLKTKLIAHKAGLQVPELLHVVSTQHQVQGVERELSQISQFVIKPAQGSGGKGILIIQDQADGEFIKSNGERVTLAAVKRHLSNIISGLYSLGGRSDVAIVESLVKVTPLFSNVSHEGVPDIRLIVFQGYPVMGMLRLATKASDGKANLHQGAVGVGLDIGTGQSIAAVQDNRVISVHPDTGADLARLAVPNWQQLLLLAARCFDVTQLGYLGCDIVLDEHRGPLLLEMNARPGLSIQIANDEGLLPRLEHVEALDTFARSVEDRVAYAMQAFTRMSTVEQTSLWEES